MHKIWYTCRLDPFGGNRVSDCVSRPEFSFYEI